MTSRELLTAQKNGAQILHNGVPVVFAPRYPGDRTPWVFYDGHTEFRYSAVQCDAFKGEAGRP